MQKLEGGAGTAMSKSYVDITSGTEFLIIIQLV